jgi:peptidoglycan/xylan/chitin deacetylase (PgdA/CDA1 family)
MSRHKKKKSPSKPPKPLIRQCVWCKKPLKTGEYLTEGKEAFCGRTCLGEWQTRQSIVKRELDGQNRTLYEQRLKAHGLVNAPVTETAAPPLEAAVAPEAAPLTPETIKEAFPAVSRQDLIRGISVSEFLDGRSDEEIERLAGQLMSRRPRGSWLNAYNVALAGLSLLLVIVLLATYSKKEKFYAIALDNKKKIETLKHRVETLTASTVPVDTAGLKLLSPKDGAILKVRSIAISGMAGDTLNVTLIVNGRIRSQRLVPGGRFEFTSVGLSGGENSIIVKGIGPNNKICTRRMQVTVEEKPVAGTRNINYDTPQSFVPNQYPDNLNYTRGNSADKSIALTFDGGSHAGEAQNILDTLKSRGVKATFFLTGQFVENHLALAKRMIAEDHVLGNHTYSHPHLTTYESDREQRTLPGVTPEFLREELLKTRQVFERNGLPWMPLWRAPYGEQNRAINAWAEEAGYKHIGWTQGTGWKTNLDTNDWVERPGEAGFFYPDEVVRKIINFGKGTPQGLSGGIILMHIGTLRKDFPLYEKIGSLIDTLRSSGYRFVTVPEMLAKD